MRCLHPCRPGRPGDHNGVGQAEVGRPTRTPRRLPVRFLCARASGEARGRVPHRGGLAAGVQRHQGPRSALAAGERAVLVIVRRRDTAQPSLGDRGEAELGGEGTQVAGRGVGDLHARMGARVARVRVGHRQNRRRVGAPRVDIARPGGAEDDEHRAVLGLQQVQALQTGHNPLPLGPGLRVEPLLVGRPVRDAEPRRAPPARRTRPPAPAQCGMT